MAMPKTSINKDYNIAARKDNVRCAREAFVVAAETNSLTAQKFFNDFLDRCIGSSNSTH
jgi:hypothetical protein